MSAFVLLLQSVDGQQGSMHPVWAVPLQNRSPRLRSALLGGERAGSFSLSVSFVSPSAPWLPQLLPPSTVVPENLGLLCLRHSGAK